MWNDQLTRHMSAFDANFVSARKGRSENKLILHWWWYSNTALNDKTKVSIGEKLGIELGRADDLLLQLEHVRFPASEH